MSISPATIKARVREAAAISLDSVDFIAILTYRVLNFPAISYIRKILCTMARSYFYVTLLLALASLSAAAHKCFEYKYPFSSILLNDSSKGHYYAVYWNFSIETQRISFAVNVSTTGWVGFGLSPNGGMPGSDVVIGWVNQKGESFFKDRYAVAEALPPVDTNQNWCLTSALEENGYTSMEFERNFTTCDKRDRDIMSDTARVIWSFNTADPIDDKDSNPTYHTQRGSASLNLLGGNPDQPLLGNELFLDITVSNVLIPNATTTYWCESYKLPSDVINTTHFINRISPAITPHNHEFVHHILVYLCPVNTVLTDTEVNVSKRCSNLTENLQNCLSSGILIGGWAVGGDDFVYPKGVSFPVGGIGQEQYIVMETHYNNPNQQNGVVDSSGLRFYYNIEEPTYRAGMMYLGHTVNSLMMIPPRNPSYTVTSVCTADCTSQYIPPEGITIIGNLLHTHLVGKSITISHYRHNSTTDQLVELEPLDQNLNYDFNYQQFTYFQTPRKVLPGDVLVTKCTYDTSARDNLTFGGDSTQEEMCISFPIFYPRPSDGSAIVHCSSYPDPVNSFYSFGTYVIVNGLASFEQVNNDFISTVQGLNWTADPMLSESLRNSVNNGNAFSFCLTERGNFSSSSQPIPTPDVPYVAPNKCNGVPKGQCVRDETAGAQLLMPAGFLGITFVLIHSLITFT